MMTEPIAKRSGLFYPSTRARENPYYPIYVKTTLYIMSCWIIGLWKCGVSFIKDLFSPTTAVQTGSFWYVPVFSLDNGRQNMRCNSPRFRKAFPGCWPKESRGNPPLWFLQFREQYDDRQSDFHWNQYLFHKSRGIEMVEQKHAYGSFLHLLHEAVK